MTRGLPARLPQGERLLWQGAPDWRALARDALHARKLAAYFGLIVIWIGVSSVSKGAAPAETAVSVLRAALFGAVPVALALAYAWGVARTSVYTITDRRLVLHVGLALPVTMNLPFTQITSADLTRHASGSGNISVTVSSPKRLSYIVLWPHVRPWRLTRVEPTLRAIADLDGVAQILARALAASADMATPVLQTRPAAPTSAPHAAMVA